MKCPPRFKELIEVDEDLKYHGADCIKEECAWWDTKSNGCSIYLISRSLMAIADILIDLKEKMPQAEE